MQKGASLRPGQGYTGLLEIMGELSTEEGKKQKKIQRAIFTAKQNLPYEVKLRRQARRAWEFWTDGCNMNLTRNHMISYKRDIVELCEKAGMPLPEAFKGR